MAGLSIDRKRDYHTLRWLILIILAALILGTIYYAYDYYVNGDKPPLVPLPAAAYADTSVGEAPLSQSQVDGYRVPATHPRYISIPALGLSNARVVVVGLTKQKMLDTPRNIADTAWYSASATPGQGYGQVVIDGHSSGVSRDGVFINLDKLHNGDKIIVERGDSKKITYDVVKDVTMPLAEVNATGMQQLLQPADQSREGLGLITFAGKWIPRDRQFNERVLVWAVAEK